MILRRLTVVRLLRILKLCGSGNNFSIRVIKFWHNAGKIGQVVSKRELDIVLKIYISLSQIT